MQDPNSCSAFSHDWSGTGWVYLCLYTAKLAPQKSATSFKKVATDGVVTLTRDIAYFTKRLKERADKYLPGLSFDRSGCSLENCGKVILHGQSFGGEQVAIQATFMDTTIGGNRGSRNLGTGTINHPRWIRTKWSHKEKRTILLETSTDDDLYYADDYIDGFIAECAYIDPVRDSDTTMAGVWRSKIQDYDPKIASTAGWMQKIVPVGGFGDIDPAKQIAQLRKPFLLVHDLWDDNVSPEQSLYFMDQAAGLPQAKMFVTWI